MFVETVTASEVMGDSANVDDVVPAVLSDSVVSVAEKKMSKYYSHDITSTMRRYINEIKYIAYYR